MRARLHCLLAVAFAGVTLLFSTVPAAAQEAWLVRTEPGTPVVAMEVLVATGPIHEDSLQAGLAFLSARALMAPIRPRLDSLGARLLMEGHKDAISFSLISPPETWIEASRTLLIALFRDPPYDHVVERERRSLASELLARQASPVFGASHPWGRPAVGFPHTVSRVSGADVDQFLRTYVTPERSVVAVIGPVARSEVAEHLRPFFPPGRLRRPEPVAAQASGRPVVREYNSITTWVAAVYPLREDTDLEAVRFLAEGALSALSFGPSRRSIYDVQVEIFPRVGGGELRIQVVVPPDEARQWGERITDAIGQYARAPLQEDQFEAQLRYFRGRRLLALGSPEARAREIARAFLVRGTEPRDFGAAFFDELSIEGIHETARSLGAPKLIYLGPNLDTTR
jgi:predicted Zn-dependent peptidase